MNATLWTVTIIAALAYSAGGASLLLMSRQRYRALAASQQWVDDFGDRLAERFHFIPILFSTLLSI